MRKNIFKGESVAVKTGSSPGYLDQGGSLPDTLSQGRRANLSARWPVAMVISVKPLAWRSAAMSSPLAPSASSESIYKGMSRGRVSAAASDIRTEVPLPGSDSP